MIELLLKASFAITIGFLFYKFLLQQESFFAANRFYLLGCIALAFALPFVTLPPLVHQQGYLAALFQQSKVKEAVSLQTTSNQTTRLQVTEPVNKQEPANLVLPRQNKPIWKKSVAETEPKTKTENLVLVAANYGWLFWLSMLYLFGVAVFALSLLFQLGSILYKISRASDKMQDGDYVLVSTESRQAPCSFFRYIFIYPNDYDFETYEQIIAHEKIHARLGHSLDLLIAEIAVIVLWFNPLVWLLKKEIEKNNEYQTDALLLEKEQVPRDKYQLNLLQIAVPNKPLNITTNYNQSLLKQRIMMMNAKKSTPQAYWKYAFLVPLFFGILLLINEPAVSQQVNPAMTAPTPPEAPQPMERIALDIKETINETIRVLTPVEIPLAPEVPETPAQLLEPVPEPAPAPAQPAREPLPATPPAPAPADMPPKASKNSRELSINIHGDRTDMTQGFWYSSREGNEYCIQFKGSKQASTWNMSQCFNQNLFKKSGPETFVMTKETGALQLTGNLNAEVGQGKYTFTEDAGFQKFLSSNNITSTDQNWLFHLFLGNISKTYVNFLKKEYNEVSGNRLLELAIHGIPQETFQKYIALFQKHSNRKPSIQEVVEARIHGIDENYVQELQRLGYTDVSMKKMMEAKIHGVSTVYVQNLKSAGFANISLDKVINAKIHGVKPEAIKEIQSLGFGDLSLDKIIELKIHGINPAYISDLKSVGFENLTISQVLEAKIHGLNPTSVKEIKAMGYKDLDFRDIVSAKIHGVNGAYVEDLKKAGFQNIAMNKVVEAKIHGIDGTFIKQSREKGYNLNSLDKYIALKIHGSAMESLKN